MKEVFSSIQKGLFTRCSAGICFQMKQAAIGSFQATSISFRRKFVAEGEEVTSESQTW